MGRRVSLAIGRGRGGSPGHGQSDRDQASICLSKRLTLAADQDPRPRAVGMPASFNPAAMVCGIVFPAACNCLMAGITSATLAAARFKALVHLIT